VRETPPAGRCRRGFSFLQDAPSRLATCSTPDRRLETCATPNSRLETCSTPIAGWKPALLQQQVGNWQPASDMLSVKHGRCRTGRPASGLTRGSPVAQVFNLCLPISARQDRVSPARERPAHLRCQADYNPVTPAIAAIMRLARA
jgi:hypothetical protein